MAPRGDQLGSHGRLAVRVCPAPRGESRTEARMGAPMIVVNHSFLHHGPQMPLIRHDQPVQALATESADQPLAERICLRAPTARASLILSSPLLAIFDHCCVSVRLATNCRYSNGSN